MYKCCDCGEIFTEPDFWEEGRGEFWGVSCSETVSGCPYCRGDYEEVHECEICGEYLFEDEMYGDVCDNCIDNYKYDVDVCYEIGAEDTEEIKINCFLFAMFDTAEIETILYNHLKNANKEIDCSPFIDNDRFWFAEKLLEKRGVIENENTKD